MAGMEPEGALSYRLKWRELGGFRLEYEPGTCDSGHRQREISHRHSNRRGPGPSLFLAKMSIKIIILTPRTKLRMGIDLACHEVLKNA